MELSRMFKLFFLAIIIDFITGVLVAGKSGKLKSRTCSNGLFRTIGECIVLSIFVTVTNIIPECSDMVFVFMGGFIFKEGLSIVENLIGLGVWVPESLKRVLEVGVDKVNSGEFDTKEEVKK